MVEPFCCTVAHPLPFRHLISFLPTSQPFISPPTQETLLRPQISTSFLASNTIGISNEARNFFDRLTFQVIIRATKRFNTRADLEPCRYYGLLAHRMLILGNNEELRKGGWVYITTRDAENSIKLEESGIVVGNGEDWEEIDQEEMCWEENQFGWKLEAWVQILAAGWV